jgi:hypothetical protein
MTNAIDLVAFGTPLKFKAGEIPNPSQVLAVGRIPPLLKSGLPTIKGAEDCDVFFGAAIFPRNRIVLSNLRSDDQTKEAPVDQLVAK